MNEHRFGKARIARAGWALGISLALAVSCRDSAREADARTARDRAALDAIIAGDEKLDRALKQADDASREGDEARAATLLERTSLPAADEALSRASSAHLETPWGQARRDELVAVLTDRRAEIPRYAAALRGGDLDAKLAAVEAQLALQRRAVQAVTAALAPSAQDSLAPPP